MRIGNEQNRKKPYGSKYIRFGTNAHAQESPNFTLEYIELLRFLKIKTLRATRDYRIL